jgi:SDR family mycofactocin-dependent oxidoreductase
MNDRAPLAGQVAIVTGAGRGQGRAHAVGLAADGADIVALDIGHDVGSVPYELSTGEDLADTVRQVEALGRACMPITCDVRDSVAVAAAVAAASERFGKVDITIANAGIASYGTVAELTDEQWRDVIDTNLTGVFNILRATVPAMVDRGYGRLVATASMAARGGTRNAAHYVAAKWGVIGLAKSLALEVAASGVTVNVICPANVNTRMINNETMYRLFRPDLAEPRQEDVLQGFTDFHQIPVPWVEPEEIAGVVRFMVSPAAAHITGSVFDVACGNTALIP